jgi:hypothetical protein
MCLLMWKCLKIEQPHGRSPVQRNLPLLFDHFWESFRPGTVSARAYTCLSELWADAEAARCAPCAIACAHLCVVCLGRVSCSITEKGLRVLDLMYTVTAIAAHHGRIAAGIAIRRDVKCRIRRLGVRFENWERFWIHHNSYSCSLFRGAGIEYFEICEMDAFTVMCMIQRS